LKNGIGEERRAIQLVRLKRASNTNITASRDNESQPQRVLIFSRNDNVL
jgi:hypothetical protein